MLFVFVSKGLHGQIITSKHENEIDIRKNRIEESLRCLSASAEDSIFMKNKKKIILVCERSSEPARHCSGSILALNLLCMLPRFGTVCATDSFMGVLTMSISRGSRSFLCQFLGGESFP